LSGENETCTQFRSLKVRNLRGKVRFLRRLRERSKQAQASYVDWRLKRASRVFAVGMVLESEVVTQVSAADDDTRRPSKVSLWRKGTGSSPIWVQTPVPSCLASLSYFPNSEVVTHPLVASLRAVRKAKVSFLRMLAALPRPNDNRIGPKVRFLRSVQIAP